MLKFGFELEGFFEQSSGVAVPPERYPTDGFPGLVELRTTGGATLEECYASIIRQNLDTPGVNFALSSHVFSRDERGLLRRRQATKVGADIRNLYGCSPRLLGNKTIASFQLNVSNLLSASYTKSNGEFVSDRYGAIDVPRIVRSLDAAFAAEIKLAGRQPGEYAIKDDVRLEYRSLPNSVFPFDPNAARIFLLRLRNAVEAN